MVILEVRDIHKEFGGVRALSGVFLGLEEGRITSLIGPNGAGKTTLFNIIGGLLEPSRGSVLYRGREITGLTPHRIARLGVGRTFQDPRVFRNLSSLENVMSGFPGRGWEDPFYSLLRGQRLLEGLKERGQSLLGLVELGDKREDRAWTLSYGQQRFLSIARTLATRAEILLMDEPSVGLDGEGVSALKEILRHLVDREGRTVLLVEHNMDVVMDISDQVILMVEGKVVASGTPSEIKASPLVIEAYLGVRYVAGDH